MKKIKISPKIINGNPCFYPSKEALEPVEKINKNAPIENYGERKFTKSDGRSIEQIIHTDSFKLPSGVIFSWEERKKLGIENLTYKQMCFLSDKIMEKYYPIELSGTKMKKRLEKVIFNPIRKGESVDKFIKRAKESL